MRAKILLIAVLSVFLLLGFFIILQSTSQVLAEPEKHTVYENSLAQGWENWSWGTLLEMNDTISGKFSPWGGMYLHSSSSVVTDEFTHFVVRVKNPSNVPLTVYFYDANHSPIENKVNLDSFRISQEGDFVLYQIPTTELNISNKIINGFALQQMSVNSDVLLEFDDIYFLKELKSSTGLANLLLGQPEWENWSWGGVVEQKGSELVFNSNTSWAGLYLHHTKGFDTNQVDQIELEVRSNDISNYQLALFDQNNQLAGKFLNLGYLPKEDIGGGWSKYSAPLRELANSPLISGFAIQDVSAANNQILQVRNIKFTQGAAEALDYLEATPAATKDQAVSYPEESIGNITGRFSVHDGKLYKNNSEIRLKGVNWFGFETDTLSPHGLWSRKWQDMVAQIHQSGFNAVRIPFCPRVLDNAPTTGIDTKLNPDLDGVGSLDLLDKVVNEMSAQGIYVLLDHHRPDCQAISELWYTDSYSEQDWIDDLVELSGRYRHVENFIGMDLKNEPHGRATWGTGNSSTDWNIAAQKAGKAILMVNPDILIFVEGIQENPSCSGSVGHWMGGNLEPLRCSGIDPNYIPANKLVLSPHVYGPDVYPQGYFSDQNFPHNLSSIWDSHFGAFANEGYAVVIGEWGGKYGEGDPKDKEWQNALVNYMNSRGLCSSFYWSWNPNSGDTGGILKDDWQSLREDKLQLLNHYWNYCKS